MTAVHDEFSADRDRRPNPRAPMNWTLLLLAACTGSVPKPDADRGDSAADTGAGEDTAADSDGDSDGDTAEESGGDTAAPLVLVSVDPAIVDPLGGSHLTVFGAGFAADGDHGAVTSVTIGGVAGTGLVVASDTELRVVTGPVAAGPGLDLVVLRGDDEAVLSGVIEAWSPAELSGARVFDASVGVEVEEASTLYEWQRLTPEISPDWRVRDGNTTTWLPSTGRYWMVAGWNGYQEPDGFSSVPPDTYPPENTTDEVWSSPDGITWTLELPHGNGQFERRHSHNTMLWHDRLWMIGGDTHQGYYNHDVVSSANGADWTVELGPGTVDPPWAERALQVSGVYDGKLWMVGGQDLLGPIEDYVYHNDVWSTEDGVHWTQVAADGPESDTRWAGCGVLDGLVEFRGEMWLVGCAREREDASGHLMSNDVWSTTDGITWRRHAEPPWVGKIWPNVVVWDDKLWILFGYTYGDPADGWTAGNANEAWFSEDGETWQSLPVDAPVPGSHAQGVAVTEASLLYAGGNYSFGFGAGVDKSTWRLVPFRGESVRGWTDRGAEGLVVTALDDGARPLRLPDAFGEGMPGLQFDGSRSVLALADAAIDAQPDGRSVFWVARAPYLPAPWGWVESYTPLGTIVGGPVEYGWLPVSSVGLSDGQVVVLNLEEELGDHGEFVWSRIAGGGGLQEGPGDVRMAGITHAADGSLTIWMDGAPASDAVSTSYATPRAWSQIGGGLNDAYYGPNSRFAGTLGAVIVLPEVVDEATVAKIHTWARGRFDLAR